eukprot:CAMPEP_0113896790 /NCGR_PEP_ID=MMETSP0780_2-20120614/18256_1 /TAXON_ID=652834 /ORGANISM="Palpitomonas bilix" /LENGTH=41 /DNA_ID=CAMNT_0000888055 /DNA_START=466 /DNA_END=591 /DNA_ORIENTATION=+ /assembly_acc=CAM_ASM_000599
MEEGSASSPWLSLRLFSPASSLPSPSREGRGDGEEGGVLEV